MLRKASALAGDYARSSAVWRHLAAVLVVAGACYGLAAPAEAAASYAYAAVLLLWANRREALECTARLEVALAPRPAAPGVMVRYDDGGAVALESYAGGAAPGGAWSFLNLAFVNAAGARHVVEYRPAAPAPAVPGADYLTTNALACAELGGIASSGYYTPERPGARVELHLAPAVLRRLRGREGFLEQLEAERLLVARVLEVTVLDEEDPLPPLEQLGTTPDECRACGSREVALVAGVHGDRWACARCHALRVG